MRGLANASDEKAANCGVGGLSRRVPSGIPPCVNANGMQHRIDGLLSDGASLERVEAEVIDRSGLRQDEKSALWLYAWSLADRPSRPERDVEACAALFAGSD
jgi:hypothetical protein